MYSLCIFLNLPDRSVKIIHSEENELAAIQGELEDALGALADSSIEFITDGKKTNLLSALSDAANGFDIDFTFRGCDNEYVGFVTSNL